MSNITKLIDNFIAANAVAYGKASKVFKAIEAEDYATTLAEAGIVGADVQVYATIYVAKVSESGVKPHPSQRDKSKLVFKKDSPEYNRVKYIVDVATGVRAVRATKKAEKHNRIDPELRKAAQAYLKLFGNVAEAVSILRAVAK